MKSKLISCLIIIFIVRHQAICQSVFPPDGIVFNDKIVARIDIVMHKDSLAELLKPENLQQDHEYPADFYWDDGIRKDSMRKIGFRLRGNTSRTSAKKSFKIKFNKFISNKFYGLSDLNLNGEHNDPSIIRSKLSWDLMKMAGLEAPRSNHVALYINGEYRGLYINVEHIDNDFLEARKKDPQGQLFKLLYGCDFLFNGNNPNNYSRSVYEAQNNKSDPDYYTLMEFIKILNNTNDPEYRCHLEQVFDVDNYLKRMAMEVILGHWDNPIYNKNNAYLYYNPVQKKFELISYDIDNTFGIDWFGINWANRNIYSWAHPTDPRPIYTNLLNVPEYRIRYGYYVKKFVQEFFNPNFLNPHIDRIKTLISPFRINDNYARLDYGYSYSDFQQSFEKPTGAHVKFGLKEYINQRSAAALSQIQNTNISPIAENPYIQWNSNTFMFNIDITGISQVTAVVYYRKDNEPWQEVILKDDGIFPDSKSMDNRYSLRIAYTGKPVIYLYINIKDEFGKSAVWPVCNYLSIPLGYDEVPQLYINEFMADNNIIKDNNGEYEDWIEIYNGGSSAVWLGDKYLTDNPLRPDKWPLPDFDLNAGDFLLIWADEDQDQGPFHANFKLSKSGEFIGIFDSKENNYAPIDTFSFNATLTNVSYGYYPDGKGSVILLPEPSAGKSNVVSTTNNPEKAYIQAHPNPFSGFTMLNGLLPSDQVTLFDIHGCQIQSQFRITDHKVFDGLELSTGIYFLNIARGSQVINLKVIKL